MANKEENRVTLPEVGLSITCRQCDKPLFDNPVVVEGDKASVTCSCEDGGSITVTKGVTHNG